MGQEVWKKPTNDELRAFPVAYATMRAIEQDEMAARCVIAEIERLIEGGWQFELMFVPKQQVFGPEEKD